MREFVIRFLTKEDEITGINVSLFEDNLHGTCEGADARTILNAEINLLTPVKIPLQTTVLDFSPCQFGGDIPLVLSGKGGSFGATLRLGDIKFEVVP